LWDDGAGQPTKCPLYGLRGVTHGGVFIGGRPCLARGYDREQYRHNLDRRKKYEESTYA
jgi:hypothetical protein